MKLFNSKCAQGGLEFIGIVVLVVFVGLALLSSLGIGSGETIHSVSDSIQSIDEVKYCDAFDTATKNYSWSGEYINNHPLCVAGEQ